VRKACRIGLGITGLADTMIMLGMRYGDGASRAVAGDLSCCLSSIHRFGRGERLLPGF
jgi:hypothetical protein